MSLQDYFESRARDGSWSELYDGSPSPANYNFHTRRTAVRGMLDADATYQRILDVGCGTGDYAELATRHGGTFYGIDFSPTMVAQGRDKARTAGHPSHFFAGSGTELPCADDTFDLVIAIGYLPYFHDPRPAIDEIRRVLRPGGTLVAQASKADVMGWLDRHIVFPLRRLRHRQKAKPAALPAGWVNVRYAPRAFNRLITAAGFTRVDHTFNHFQSLPGPLRARWGHRHMRVSERMSRHPRLWRALAVNYVGKYRLNDGPASTGG